MPHAAGKAGTPFHGYILNVVFYPGGDIEPLKKEQYWLGMVLPYNVPVEEFAGMWLGRMPLEWAMYTWTPQDFEREMELC